MQVYQLEKVEGDVLEPGWHITIPSDRALPVMLIELSVSVPVDTIISGIRSPIEFRPGHRIEGFV